MHEYSARNGGRLFHCVSHLDPCNISVMGHRIVGGMMDWGTFWGAVATSTAVAAAGGWLAKGAIEASFKHVFDRQIEALKSELRDNENALNSLRTNVLGRLAARNQELDKRRLNASFALWAATVRQRRFHTLVGMVSRLNIPAIREKIESDPVLHSQMMQMADLIWKMSGIENNSPPTDNNPEFERLFLPSEAWLQYEALSEIGTSAMAIVAALKTGAPLSLMKDPSETNGKLKAALPHQSQMIDKYPYAAPAHLMEELEQKILASLMAAIDDDDARFAAIETASALPNSIHVPADVLDKIPVEVRADTPQFLP